MQTPDPSTLTHEYLIRNAASQTIDCVSTVITQTALAIIETEKIYKEVCCLLILPYFFFFLNSFLLLLFLQL